ncbi:hypothetical protein [Actinokineospora sp. HUAS TT18]|uniref:hypothetical protein n=1 Tax=Actinokineospora sp. HUAS TT18 TaxID=3447451 RepID=UPI003F520FC6
MSRVQQNSTGRLRIAPAALGLSLVAVLGAVGCSAGQITQTDSQLPAVNGAMSQAGKLALRDAALAYPHGGHYAAGADAPLILTIVNSGAEADELVEVSSPFATEVELVGDKNVPGTAALVVGTPGEEAEAEAHSSVAPTPTPTSAPSGSVTPSGTANPSGSATPSSGAHGTSEAHPTTTAAPTSSAKPQVGKIKIVLVGLKEKLFPGRMIPVTFVFAKSGSVTVELPIASPNAPRGDSDH